MKRLPLLGRATLLIAVVALSLPSATRKAVYSPRERAFYANAALVEFVRPGLVFKITSAQIASDGTITATVSITDPQGLPLDTAGVTTPGVVATNFIVATIPSGQSQYTSYTTRSRTGTFGTVMQAAADTGGVLSTGNGGSFQYTFATKAPAGFDVTATHTIGVYGSRNLTAFNLGTSYASNTYDFRPDGGKVAIVRDLVSTASCNGCHDQLSFHGGSRRGVEMCVLCHTPQTLDPATGVAADFKLMIHKIHDGAGLPSVKAGTPYTLNGSDWSTVVYPADVRRCETCHSQKSGAVNAANYLTKPSRAACGSCHDDVNFATGVNHAAGPQFDDNLCGTCHIPQGEIDFDASIKGAHVIPTESSLLSGLAVSITTVQKGTAGSQPVVNFAIRDTSEKAVPTAALSGLTFTMAGPASDLGYTSFGSDVTTPGYVSESATSGASCGADGNCLYTFKHAVPVDARGTYSIGVEARRTEIVLAGTTKEQSVTYGAKNQVVSFSVDGSPPALRRTVVATANCNGCHVALSVHGTLRNQTEYCVLCHNPSNTDASQRVNARDAADKAAPPQGINFNLLVHRIHTGENLLPDNRPYVVVGFGGSHNDFSDVRYPAMSPTGATGDTRNCSMCHVGGSEQKLPAGLNAVMDPQGPINPILPVASACTGCHVKIVTASHALANTTALGESCAVCHNSGAAFSVGQVHAQY